MTQAIENLFIIGNGFDLAHGLPTRYDDFKKFLYSHYGLSDVSLDEAEYLADYEFPESRMAGDGGEVFEFDDYAKVYFKICNNLNEDRETHQTEWNNFEGNLAKITLIDVDGMNIMDKEGDLDGSQTAHLLAVTSEQFNQAYQGMTQHFFERWIRSVVGGDRYQELLNVCCRQLKELILQRRHDSYFLTFNYTPVLEEIYSVPQERVLHIHGEIDNTPLIVGHGEELLDSDYIDNPLDFDFSEAKRQSRKPVADLIEQNRAFFENYSEVKRIYIIGSSIVDGNAIDLPYLKAILSHIKGQVTVYLDSYGMNQQKKNEKEQFLKGVSGKVKDVKVIDSYHNVVLECLHR